MLNRRQILMLCGAWAAMGFPVADLIGSAQAGPRDAKKRLAELTGGVKPQKGRISITLPKVTDQGRFVPIRISVDSPMNENDYVKAIHIVAERNPSPEIASFHLSPANGKAQVSTRIRLLKTQVVVVAAEMNDGSVYLGKGRSKITGGAGGCG
ncbi:MAG: thiosulfate oxidation carrier protein SoxY [Candidatus Thiodiazotropha sp.]